MSKTQVISVSREVSLSLEESWNCFFNELSEWWSKDFHTSQRTKRFIIDTKVGGHQYEDFGDGEGLIWGDVIGVDAPKSLQTKGYLNSDFGGPTLTFEKYSFEKLESNKTIVTYSAHFLIAIAPSSLKSLQDGWEMIMDLYQKHSESKGS